MDPLPFIELTARTAGQAIMARSGNVEVVAELAAEFDFSEDDGSRPASIRSLQYLLPNFVFPQVEAESGKPVPDWIKNNVPDLLLPWAIFAGEAPPEPPTFEGDGRDAPMDAAPM